MAKYDLLNAVSDHGQTALHLAQIHGHDEIAGMLVGAGAKLTPMLPCLVDNCNNKCRIPHNCEKVHPRS